MRTAEKTFKSVLEDSRNAETPIIVEYGWISSEIAYEISWGTGDLGRKTGDYYYKAGVTIVVQGEEGWQRDFEAGLKLSKCFSPYEDKERAIEQARQHVEQLKDAVQFTKKK